MSEGGQRKPLNNLKLAAHRRFERPTPRLGGVCSIQLSYEDICSFLGERRERTYLTGLRLSDY